ncbi:putative disease resistance RPP13-like protein 1 [Vitis vinifera]|uniref:Putative disease resistance RPP13-like protein 1 n=1 Tax=Vitis vinifera TaxID=29760 RepID=A0A438J6L7_VITVI|nr:putative disease resistance RPP13-like protein 1 [Vitis vinifera]
MAGALVGGAFLSASLQVLFDRLASREVVSFIQGRKLSDALLKKLERKLLVVHAVLNDAEVKQFTDPYVKKWLVLLKETVYDAEDILDEIATEALRHKMEAAESQTSTSQVGNIMDMCTWVHAPFDSQSIESRVEEIIDRLEDMARDRAVLGLKEGVGEKLSQRWPSTSLVDESLVYGRHDEKQKMIEQVLSDNARRDEIGVISIVGMGGLGKTTLAQLLYNDARVMEHFDLKAWVCVSEEFDPIRVTKTILEEITSSTFETNNLNQLQVKLKERINTKKFLLVLDDVWNEDSSNWAMLQTPLKGGAKGSKIVVTTRSTNVAAVMRAVYSHCLGELSSEDSWSLFRKLAFENGDSSAYPQLEAIGKKIVDKCQGLPLAVKAVGGLLHSEVEARKWDDILNSQIWDLSTDTVLPALRLSYNYLPSHLKQCFAYCSIFPKDYVLEKEKLILLWMAEGLLQESKGKRRMEEVGDLYFHELLSKSFFQNSVWKKKTHFVMHDLIHDLAQLVSGEFSVSLEDGRPVGDWRIEGTFRYKGNTYNFKVAECEMWQGCKRSQFEGQDVHGGVSVGLGLESRRGEFPRLQELYIKKCPKLTGKLPKQLRSLKKLEIVGCPQLLVASLKVPAISELTMVDCGKLQLKRPTSGFTALQTSHVKISNISQWKQLPVGVHRLSITECDSVETLIEEEPVQSKTCLFRYLEITYCCLSRSLHRVGLPTNALESLKISHCSKLEFLLPVLLRCHHPFLKNIHIRDNTCDSLSLSFSLSIFPRLRCFEISKLQGLEFLYISVSEGDPTSLNSLNISRCPDVVYIELPALDLASYEISGCLKLKLLKHTLSTLRCLRLFHCPELLFQRDGLPSNLRELEISSCDQLTSQVDWGLQRLASLTRFNIRGGCQDVHSLPWECLLPSTITTLRIEQLPNLKSLDSKGLQQLTSLSNLYIGDCPEFQSFGEEGLQHLTSLTTLSIRNCSELQSFGEEGLQHLTSLVTLSISSCSEFQSFGEEGLQHLTSLITLSISNCSELQSFGEEGLQHLTSLKTLSISCCPKLKSLTEAGLQHLSSVEKLQISDCLKLQYLTKERLPNSLSLLAVDKCSLLEGMVPSSSQGVLSDLVFLSLNHDLWDLPDGRWSEEDVVVLVSRLQLLETVFTMVLLASRERSPE